MLGDPDIPSLAAWLHQYSPISPLASLQDSLNSDQHLSLALERLRQTSVHAAEREEQQQTDLHHAQQKIQTLRNSLSHFSSHANSLSDRLVRAESSSVSQHQRYTQQLQQAQEEADSVKALCLVWEGRWREERALREEAESNLREATTSSSRKLNGAAEQDETRVYILKGSKFSSKSRSRSPQPPSTDSWNVKVSSQTVPLTETSVAIDLTEEATRLRAEMRHLSENRDLDVSRLEAEIRLRRTEMSQLYSSLDKLLFLSSVTNGRSQSSFASQDLTASRKHISATKSNRAISPSILDLPAVQAAATHSRSRRVSDLPEGDHTKEDVQETLRLEEEIRDMERKIRMLSGGPESEGISVDPTDGSALPAGDDEASAILLTQIRELQAEVDTIRRQLELAIEEKERLAKLLEQKSTTTSTDEQGRREEAQRAYIERLEADRSRLSQLLEASEAESHSLSQELASMHAQVDSLSERVRLKLEEQRNKLYAAYDEIERLQKELRSGELRQ
ncbi:hypothetical protein JCM3765_007909 [Sporobolomyces pararoseus]